MSPGERAFLMTWNLRGLPAGEWHMLCEHRFHPVREWRFDFAFPRARLAVEIDGRGRGGHEGRHHSFTGAAADYEKHNAAAVLGWRVLRFQSHERARVNQWVETVKQALEER
jgi:very-short-patch-repair endonuclease